eukprot:gene11611-34317_t
MDLKETVLICKKSHKLFMADIYRPAPSCSELPPIFKENPLPVTLWGIRSTPNECLDWNLDSVQMPCSPVYVMMVTHSTASFPGPDAYIPSGASSTATPATSTQGAPSVDSPHTTPAQLRPQLRTAYIGPPSYTHHQQAFTSDTQQRMLSPKVRFGNMNNGKPSQFGSPLRKKKKDAHLLQALNIRNTAPVIHLEPRKPLPQLIGELQEKFPSLLDELAGKMVWLEQFVEVMVFAVLEEMAEDEETGGDEAALPPPKKTYERWTSHHDQAALDMQRVVHGVSWWKSGEGTDGATFLWRKLQGVYPLLFSKLSCKTTGNWIKRWRGLETALATVVTLSKKVDKAEKELANSVFEAQVLLEVAKKDAEERKRHSKSRPGRPNILPAEVYQAVKDFIMERSDSGAIMAPVALRGPIRNLIRTMGWGHLLAFDGLEKPAPGAAVGIFTCSYRWIQLTWQKLGLVQRAKTTEAQKLPEDYPAQCDTFVHQLAYMVAMHKGLGLHDKRQFTLVPSVAASGAVLPMQVVLKGKHSVNEKNVASLPLPDHRKYLEDLGFLFTSTDTHWATLVTMLSWVDNALVPYFMKQKHQQDGGSCILLLDGWAVQMQPAFRNHVATKYPWLILKYLPPNCTGALQPMDMGVQKPLKDAMRQVFSVYLSEVSRLQAANGIGRADIKIDCRLSVLKSVMCDVVKAAYIRLRNDKPLIISAWARSGESVPGDGGLLRCFDGAVQLEAMTRHARGTLRPAEVNPLDAKDYPSPHADCDGSGIQPLLQMLEGVMLAPDVRLEGEGAEIARRMHRAAEVGGKHRRHAVSIGTNAAARTVALAAEADRLTAAGGRGRGRGTGRGRGMGRSRGGRVGELEAEGVREPVSLPLTQRMMTLPIARMPILQELV